MNGYTGRAMAKWQHKHNGKVIKYDYKGGRRRRHDRRRFIGWRTIKFANGEEYSIKLEDLVCLLIRYPDSHWEWSAGYSLQLVDRFAIFRNKVGNHYLLKIELADEDEYQKTLRAMCRRDKEKKLQKPLRKVP